MDRRVRVAAAPTRRLGEGARTVSFFTTTRVGSEDPMRTRVIVNPAAGAGRGARRAGELRTRLEAAFGALEWIESESGAHVAELARESSARGDERVVVAGGDGTVHFAARGLAFGDTALAILPVGTGNDVARAIGLPLDASAAIDVLAHGTIRRIDLGCVEAASGARTYGCVLGVGMDSAALERIESARVLKKGKLLYTLAALRTLLTYRPVAMSIASERVRFEGDAVFAAATITGTYAGGMRIAPAADVADAKLDLLVVPRMGLARVLATFARIASGDGRASGVVAAQVERVKIDAERALPITLDGELTELTTPCEARVLAGALCVIGSPVARAVRHEFAAGAAA